MRLLRAEGVGVSRGRRALVSEVSLELAAGELVAICGPNGAGKSTLLRVLAGELRPSAGRVEFEGRALGEWDLRALARRRAVVAQHSPLSFPFGVLDVVRLGRLPHHTPAATDEAIARAALRQVGLEALAMRAYPTLSGGERQRVHVARALAQLEDATKPACLMLDEPTASLDPGHARLVLSEVAARVRSGRLGALVVLHDLNIAAQLATRIVLMAQGRAVADGPPREVLQDDCLESLFGVPMRVVTHPDAPVPLIVARLDGADFSPSEVA